MRTFNHPQLLSPVRDVPEEWENNVFACGLNSSGQCGFEAHPQIEIEESVTTYAYHMEDSVATRIPMSRKYFKNSNDFLGHMDRIVQIEAGWYHTLILDCRGNVYSCGAGYGHQNGHNTSGNIECYSMLKLAHPIEFIACGGHHSLLITKDTRQIIAFGEARDGQCGLSRGTSAITPSTTMNVYDDTGKLLRFAYAAAGGYHSHIVDESGGVYSFGKNTYGQLGIAMTDPESTESSFTEVSVESPRLITRYETGTQLLSNEEVKIVSCSAGAWHSIFVADDGRVFGAGDTQYGQLSLPSHSTTSSKYLVPTLINDLARHKVVISCCGYFHTAFITRDNILLTTGWNAYGQCGTGDTTTQRTVHQITSLAGLQVVNARCGWNHCVALTENGCAYGFGELKHNQLPISSKQSGADYDSANTRSYFKSPTLLECFEQFPIAFIACGRGHSLFVTGRPNKKRIPGTWTLTNRSRSSFTDIEILTQ